LKLSLNWPSFSNKEFISIIKYNNLFIPSPNRVLWKHLKAVIKNVECFIILKPNKISYNFSKFFHSIMLLNTLEKLIEKVIGERLQFQLISKNFIHPNQLGELKQHSTIDVDVFLTYLICLG